MSVLPLLARLHHTVHAHGLIDAGDRVIVAVSGGADSTALAHASDRAAPALSLQRRGPRAPQPPAATVGGRGRGVLPAACGGPAGADRRRTCRYHGGGTALADLDRGRGPDRPIRVPERRGSAGSAPPASRVAHTMNDQAETVLLRLAARRRPDRPRRALSAAGAVIRPLLGARRSEVERFLTRGRPALAGGSDAIGT